MSRQTYNAQQPRIGALKGEILKHAVPVEVLGITGQQFNMDRNKSDTVIYRRWLPRGATAGTAASVNRWEADPNAHLTQEGVTPQADTMVAQDIPVQLKQYSCLYMYTDKTAELYEDNIPDEMKTQTGERMGLVREMIRYGALRGCTNRFYAGGLGRASVDSVISLPLLRAVSRSILGNRGKLITKTLGAGPNFNTNFVEASFLVFVHTDAENDIRNLPGFKEVASYAQRQPVHPMEVGSVDRFRFIVSPELKGIPDSGALIAGTTNVSTTGANADVYPFIVVGADAWGDVALRGLSSFSVKSIPHTQVDKNDPLGQRGYIGAIFWSAMFVQNDGWMAVVETAVSDLAPGA